MKYRVTHTTKYAYSQVVPVCHNLVHLAPRLLPYQARSRYRLIVHPQPVELFHRKDYFGNEVAYFSIEQAHRGLTVTAISHVRVFDRTLPRADQTPPWEEIVAWLGRHRSREAIDAVQFVAASRRVKTLQALREYALASFTPNRPILQAMIDLTSRIHKDFTYDSNATTIRTPMEEVFSRRRGVCQDFAHIQIGCLRSIGLAARYVSGYLRTIPPAGKPRLVGADASHAWISAWCGDAGWIDFDPTNNVVASTDHITVGWGTDYNDVCPIQGVIVAGGEHTMSVSVNVAPEEETASNE